MHEVWVGNMGVSLNGGTPKTPQNDPFLVGKPMVAGETHHSRKPPYNDPHGFEEHLVSGHWLVTNTDQSKQGA